MLLEQEIEAVHWAKIGYAVFTNDLDFSAILFSTRASGPSVIQIRAEDTRPEAHLFHVANTLVKYSAAIEQGAVITIDPVKARLHILPFTIPESE